MKIKTTVKALCVPLGPITPIGGRGQERERRGPVGEREREAGAIPALFVSCLCACCVFPWDWGVGCVFILGRRSSGIFLSRLFFPTPSRVFLRIFQVPVFISFTPPSPLLTSFHLPPYYPHFVYPPINLISFTPLFPTFQLPSIPLPPYSNPRLRTHTPFIENI